MYRTIDHGTTEMHVQSILATVVFTAKKIIIIKEMPGNRLTKTRGITTGSIWNTDCTCA